MTESTAKLSALLQEIDRQLTAGIPLSVLLARIKGG